MLHIVSLHFINKIIDKRWNKKINQNIFNLRCFHPLANSTFSNYFIKRMIMMLDALIRSLLRCVDMDIKTSLQPYYYEHYYEAEK